MSKIYLTSDCHFGHKNIIAYENRPFTDLVSMREQMILNHNALVSPEDTCINLGDFIMGNKEQAQAILSRMNGRKILIRGNHDGHSIQWYLDAGFDEVWPGTIIEHDGLKIFLSHCPEARPGDGAHYDLHFYGHVHGKTGHRGIYETTTRDGACLCVERWNYKPVDIDTVIAMCKAAPTTSGAI